MRIGLFTEGTYPIVQGGVSTWCGHLMDGMPEHTFVPVTLVGGDVPRDLSVHANVRDLTLVPMWGRVPAPLPFVDAGDARRLRPLLAALWRAVLDAEADLDAFAAALAALTSWRGHSLASLLSRHGSAPHIAEGWRVLRAADPGLPSMTLADAVAAAEFCDRVLALADRDWPQVDVSHVASNGPPSVLALGRRWRDGTPILVTEHGIYLRERYLALADSGLAWSARFVIGAFLRRLTQLTYREATVVAPVSEFNRRWELELGAEPARTRTVYNGVDTRLYAPVDAEPETPTVVFVGRIDPLKGLETLVDAFAIVADEVPGAQLKLFGPTPETNRAYREGLEAQIDAAGLRDAVTFEGPVASSTLGFAEGHVVALSSISEGLPYGVIEAMMAGRPTVNTDVGGVGEIVGADGSCGLLVPPRDAAALARGLVAYLRDPALRSRTGRAARERAVRLFDMDDFIAAYRRLYDEVAADRRAGQGER